MKQLIFLFSFLILASACSSSSDVDFRSELITSYPEQTFTDVECTSEQEEMLARNPSFGLGWDSTCLLALDNGAVLQAGVRNDWHEVPLLIDYDAFVSSVKEQSVELFPGLNIVCSKSGISVVQSGVEVCLLSNEELNARGIIHISEVTPELADLDYTVIANDFLVRSSLDSGKSYAWYVSFGGSL